MGEKGVVVVVEEMGEGMQCVDHPYRTNPGGICAFCLQEKLGKLVSSSKSTPFFPAIPPPSPSSPPSNTSSATHINNKGGAGSSSTNYNSNNVVSCRSGRRSSSSRKVMASSSTTTASSSSSSSSAANMSSSDSTKLTAVLKRSKSVAPRPLGGLAEVSGGVVASTDSPRKKNFWSFLYHHSLSSSAAVAASKRRSISSYSGGSRRDLKQQPAADQEEVAESPQQASLGRKVSRSRSVGCGSRSFSGDFLERISTGFGDCTLRRVESQREAKPHHTKSSSAVGGAGDEERMQQQRIKCGGLFGGFGMTSSSYWADELGHVAAGRMSTSATMAAVRGGGGRIHRSSWAWPSFASPMRAFRTTNATTRTYTVSASSAAATASTSKTGSNPSMLAVGS